MTDGSHTTDFSDLDHPYQEMLEGLRDEHGAAIDQHIRDQIRNVIHESYKELNADAGAD
jgi:hypothetical protein